MSGRRLVNLKHLRRQLWLAVGHLAAYNRTPQGIFRNSSECMNTLFVTFATLGLATAATLEPGQQVTYRGSVAPRHAESGQATSQDKTFEINWFVASADDQGTMLYWLLDERGHGAWPWPSRFGQLKLDQQGQHQGSTPPALFYDYGEGDSVVPLPRPDVTLERNPAVGQKWNQADQEFDVTTEVDQDGRATWQIKVSTGYGLKRNMLVDKATRLLVSLNERVFMNKGTEYSLEMQLAAVTRPAAAEFAKTREAFERLLAVAGKLQIQPRTSQIEWSPEQIELLTTGLPEVEKLAATTPLERLVATALRDAKLQGGRASEVEQIVAAHQGKPLPDISLPGLAGSSLATAGLAGEVTVLHFWEYRDQPLKEPYGQVGYLEYLYQKRKDDGVKVYGVAVDARLKDERERRTVLTGIRKLKSFMNLTYPLLLDDGDAIKSLGDPRIVGATLPLVVVVGRDGRIVHYHVGYYEVDRQEGLKELNAAVTGALKK